MSFAATPTTEILRDSRETVQTAPLMYSDPLSLEKRSDEAKLPLSVVEYLNERGRTQIVLFTAFSNGTTDESEKGMYDLSETYTRDANAYMRDFLGKMRNMYAAITMIMSRSHMMQITLNDVPMSYYYSVKHGGPRATKLSPNLYKRLYVTDCVTFTGAGFRGFRSTFAACYCAIVTISMGIEGDSFKPYTTTRLIISVAETGDKKGHIDNLIKRHIYEGVHKALQDTFGIELGGSFDDIHSVDKTDVGMLSIRKALDVIGGSGAGNVLTPENTGVYLTVTSTSGGDVFTPFAAMMMASFAGDEYLHDICSTKAREWVSDNLVNAESWYALVTSILLQGLSPFYEYDSAEVNKRVGPSLLSYEQREEMKRILKA